MRPLRLALTTLLVSVLVACSASVEVGDDTLDGAEVAEKVEAQLREQPNVTDGELDCPDVEDEPGAEVRCTRTVEGDGVRVTIGVTVTVKEPDEDGDNLSFKVDDEPETVTVLATALEEQVSLATENSYGQKPESVECPELPGKVEESVVCDFTVAGEPHRLQVTVTAVEGTAVNFDLDQLD